MSDNAASVLGILAVLVANVVLDIISVCVENSCFSDELCSMTVLFSCEVSSGSMICIEVVKVLFWSTPVYCVPLSTVVNRDATLLVWGS